MFMFYVSNAGKTDEERSTEPGGILQKLMIFSGKSCKNGWFGATKGWFNSKCRIFPFFFNSKCMTWVSLWAILSAWFKYHWGAILSACTHVLRILTARGPLYIYIYLFKLQILFGQLISNLWLYLRIGCPKRSNINFINHDLHWFTIPFHFHIINLGISRFWTVPHVSPIRKHWKTPAPTWPSYTTTTSPGKPSEIPVQIFIIRISCMSGQKPAASQIRYRLMI